jgi:hypothetical protein
MPRRAPARGRRVALLLDDDRLAVEDDDAAISPDDVAARNLAGDGRLAVEPWTGTRLLFILLSRDPMAFLFSF